MPQIRISFQESRDCATTMIIVATRAFQGQGRGCSKLNSSIGLKRLLRLRPLAMASSRFEGIKESPGFPDAIPSASKSRWKPGIQGTSAANGSGAKDTDRAHSELKTQALTLTGVLPSIYRESLASGQDQFVQLTKMARKRVGTGDAVGRKAMGFLIVFQ